MTQKILLQHTLHNRSFLNLNIDNSAQNETFPSPLTSPRNNSTQKKNHVGIYNVNSAS